jgi:hypothetical protein
VGATTNRSLSYYYVGTNYNGTAVTALTTNIAPCYSPIGAFGYVSQVTSNSLVFSGATANYTNVFSTQAPDRVLTNYFHANATLGILTNLIAGYYSIAFDVNAWPEVDQNGDEIEVEIFLNEVAQEHVVAHMTMSTDVRNHCSGTGIVYIPANTAISLRIRNESDASCTMRMMRVGFMVSSP